METSQRDLLLSFCPPKTQSPLLYQQSLGIISSISVFSFLVVLSLLCAAFILMWFGSLSVSQTPGWIIKTRHFRRSGRHLETVQRAHPGENPRNPDQGGGGEVADGLLSKRIWGPPLKHSQHHLPLWLAVSKTTDSSSSAFNLSTKLHLHEWLMRLYTVYLHY